MKITNSLVRFRFLMGVRINAQREIENMLAEQGIGVEGGHHPPTTNLGGVV